MNRFWLIAVPLTTIALAAYLICLTPLGRRCGGQQVIKINAPTNSQSTAQSPSDVEAERLHSVQLEKQLADTRVEAAQNEQKARALASALATNRSPETPTANPLKDPKLRETMEKQQLQAMDRRIKQLVNAGLIAKLNLSPEQAGQLRDLLRDKQKPAIEFMTSLMAGDLNESQIAETGAQMQQRIKEAEAQIRALLGPEAYASFDWQDKSEVERHQMREIRSQLSDAGHPLRPEQAKELLLAMYDERQNFKFQIDFHDPLSFDFTQFQNYFTEENLERFYREMQQLNARTLARVQTILDPEQLPEFQHALDEHLDRGRATARMTQALFPMKKRP